MPGNKRVLIFNVNWLGDVLFSTAVIRNIRRNYPDSFIACVIPKRCYPVLEANPYLDEVIFFDERETHRSLSSRLRFVRMLRKKKFDTVFLLHRSFSRAPLGRLAGIRQRIGYDSARRGFLLTRKIALPAVDSMHRIDYYLNIVEKAGLKVHDRNTDFVVEDKDRKAVDEFLQAQGVNRADILVGINAGGNWDLKRWPPGYWSELADKTVDEFWAKVIITGGPLDVELAGRIRSGMKHEAIIACNVFNLKQLGALCGKLDLFITADTGPMHIANASGAKKIIAIFGPTSIDITGPRPADNTVALQKDVGCRIPCYKLECRDNKCMRAILPDEVLDIARRIFR
jgi:lipopolysaccharide heptosyltransferase II